MQTHLAAKCFNRTLMYQHIFLKGGGLSQKSMREIKNLQSFVTRSFRMEENCVTGQRGEVGVSPRVIKIGKYCATRSRLRKKSIICTKVYQNHGDERAPKKQAFRGCPLFIIRHSWETRRGLEPKCVPQWFLGSLMGTRRSAIGQFFFPLVPK